MAIFKSFCLLNAYMSLVIANSADPDEIAASYLSLHCLYGRLRLMG